MKIARKKVLYTKCCSHHKQHKLHSSHHSSHPHLSDSQKEKMHRIKPFKDPSVLREMNGFIRSSTKLAVPIVDAEFLDDRMKRWIYPASHRRFLKRACVSITNLSSKINYQKLYLILEKSISCPRKSLVCTEWWRGQIPWICEPHRRTEELCLLLPWGETNRWGGRKQF